MKKNFWAVTSYYNPGGFRSKLNNYNIFKDRLSDQGVNLLTVECAFGNSNFELENDENVISIRGKDVMWQKERLLNIGIQNLPDSCKKFAWLDCDVLFENPDWAKEASDLLDDFPVIQPFTYVIRLPKDHKVYEGEGDLWESFAKVYKNSPHYFLNGDFHSHGHTGFAWAARKSIFTKYGLYDACIAGSGDHMMAHAFAGDWESACINRILGGNNNHRKHFENWCNIIYNSIKAKIGYTSGRLLHLWHGNIQNRKYVYRNRELAEFGFDPQKHLYCNENGLFEWKEEKETLQKWARQYFINRREDDDT